MAQVETKELSAGQIVPSFALPSTRGNQVSIRSYRQRSNLVIMFLDLERCDSCLDLLREFGDNYHIYKDLESEILAVLPHPVSELESSLEGQGLPFPILSDEDGQVTRLYLGHSPGQGPVAAIFVTDRYGDLRTVMKGETSAELPNQQSILDWLGLLETECPECGDIDVSWSR